MAPLSLLRGWSGGYLLTERSEKQRGRGGACRQRAIRAPSARTQSWRASGARPRPHHTRPPVSSGNEPAALMARPVPRHGPTSGGLPGREPCQGTGTGQKGAPCGACPSSQHRHRSGPGVTSPIRGREGLRDSPGSEGSRLSQTAASFETSGIFSGDTGSDQALGRSRAGSGLCLQTADSQRGRSKCRRGGRSAGVARLSCVEATHRKMHPKGREHGPLRRGEVWASL